MKASIITLVDDVDSRNQAERCRSSSDQYNHDVECTLSPAVTPDMVDDLLLSFRVHWTYPWDEPRLDIKTGLLLPPYTTASPMKLVACFLSHFWLWLEIAESTEPRIILEEDALFVKPLDLDILKNTKFSIVGLNDPRGATRKSGVFHSEVESLSNLGYNIIPVPSVDNQNVPQGLAGNSAYFIRPEGAKTLVGLVKAHGVWPNDAIMCKQLMPKQLGVTTTYYTRVQGTKSKTAA